jgi:Niemann-Pick C1 protein
VIAGRYVTEDNDAWEEKFLNTVWKTDSAELKYFAAATRSWGDVFGEAITGDIVLIQVAYFVMIIYLSVNLGRLPYTCCPFSCGCLPGSAAIGSRVLLALSSVLAIILAMVSAFGVCAAMGFIWSPVHSVLPFVILGLGVDDSKVYAYTQPLNEIDSS